MRSTGIKMLIVLCLLGSVSSVVAQQPPNIVFIFADDLSYHDVGAYGNEEVRTPNIDGLAEQGLQFTRAYNMGKQNMYEHSLRVPFIMNGPGIPRDEKNHTPIYLQDVTPTAIELAGGQVPDTYQFQSLLPLIGGENVRLHPAIYGAYLQNQQPDPIRLSFRRNS